MPVQIHWSIWVVVLIGLLVSTALSKWAVHLSSQTVRKIIYFTNFVPLLFSVPLYIKCRRIWQRVAELGSDKKYVAAAFPCRCPSFGC